MALPNREESFTVEITGETTQKKYEGSFTVKSVLSAREVVEIGLRTDSYNGGSKTIAVTGIGLINRATAHMEVATVNAPSWWKDSDGGRDLLDVNVILEVYNKALDTADVYKKKIEESAKGAEEFAAANPKKKAAAKE